MIVVEVKKKDTWLRRSENLKQYYCYLNEESGIETVSENELRSKNNNKFLSFENFENSGGLLGNDYSRLCSIKLTEKTTLGATAVMWVDDHPSLEIDPDIINDKDPGHLRIYFSMESRTNRKVHNPSGDFLIQNYFYDILMTYEMNSTIPLNYLNLNMESELYLNNEIENYKKSKKFKVAYFASNCGDHTGRDKFVAELSNYIEVHSFGKCRHNADPTLENSYDIDYVTEKFYEPLKVGSIPIYRGAPNVAKFSPHEDSYINTNDFQNVKSLADYLHNIIEDDELHFQKTMEKRKIKKRAV
ncbi:Alpha3-fucosyltransferase [Lobulomyces angularis]|nr:Alpha3-fucosyltransferase [Lobulomyces angularis]